MKIILENIQNIDYTELDFESGLNVITGNNGQGKTCLMRALNSLIFNPKRVRKGFKKNTNGLIQNGKDFARVTVKCKDYPDIVWYCNEEGTKYTIGGEDYTKSMGGLSLVDLLKRQPFSLLEGECLNLSKQHAKALLFDRPSANVFTLINSLYEIVDTAQELQNFKNYKTSINNMEEDLQGKIELIEENIRKRKNIAEKIEVEKLNKSYTNYKEKRRTYNLLRDYLEVKEELKNLKRELEEVNKIDLDFLKQYEKLFKLSNIYKVRIKLQGTLQQLQKSKTLSYHNLDKIQNINKLSTEIKTYKVLLTETQEELKTLKESVIGTICPTCNQPIKELV